MLQSVADVRHGQHLESLCNTAAWITLPFSTKKDSIASIGQRSIKCYLEREKRNGLRCQTKTARIMTISLVVTDSEGEWQHAAAGLRLHKWPQSPPHSALLLSIVYTCSTRTEMYPFPCICAGIVPTFQPSFTFTLPVLNASVYSTGILIGIGLQTKHA